MGTKKMKKLTTEDILSSVDIQPEDIEVPQWGGTLTVQAFSKGAQQRARKAAMQNGEIDADSLEMIMFVEGVVEPKFTADDFDALKEKSAVAIDLVLERIMAISGISEEEEKEAGKFFRPES